MPRLARKLHHSKETGKRRRSRLERGATA